MPECQKCWPSIGFNTSIFVTVARYVDVETKIRIISKTLIFLPTNDWFNLQQILKRYREWKLKDCRTECQKTNYLLCGRDKERTKLKNVSVRSRERFESLHHQHAERAWTWLSVWAFVIFRLAYFSYFTSKMLSNVQSPLLCLNSRLVFNSVTLLGT